MVPKCEKAQDHRVRRCGQDHHDLVLVLVLGRARLNQEAAEWACPNAILEDREEVELVYPKPTSVALVLRAAFREEDHLVAVPVALEVELEVLARPDAPQEAPWAGCAARVPEDGGHLEHHRWRLLAGYHQIRL